MTIVSINLRQLRNPSIITFCDGVVKIGGRHNLATLGLKPAHDAFVDTLVALNAQYALERGSIFTKKILAADRRRDKAVVGIRQVAEGYINHFDPATAEAANVIIRVIDKYGSKIQSMPYNDQSGVMKSLAEDLQTAPVSEAVAKLGLTAWVVEMKESNQAFIDLYDNRTEEKGKKPTTKMLDLRQHTIDAWNKLVRSIKAVNELSASTALDAYAAELNAHIDQYNRPRPGDDNDEPEA